MAFFSKSAGILGINARNLLYIKQFNSGTNKKLADDKIYTKNFLRARGIGVARLYASIKSLQELRNFNPKALPKSFVIKPNRGFGGEGIITITKTINKKYVDINNKSYTWLDLAQHCISILDGRFAVSGLHDQVIFEERLLPHEYFNKFIDHGLPDIRIIVFKYIPIIAMLRLPTLESEGKANLHLGAIGLGVDIGTGKTTYGVKYNKFISKLPSGESVRNITIPQWDEILITAAKTQYISQIGYLAVDLVLTNNGIKLLELNARAGLAIQISNQALLRKRLEKIADLKVTSPAEGVRLGKTLFTKVIKKDATKEREPAKPVIGLYEYINIINAQNGTILAKIDPHSQKNIIDKSIELQTPGKLITIKVEDKKIKIPYVIEDLRGSDYKAVISGRYLSDFLIDAAKKVPAYQAKLSAETKEEKIIQNIDKKIHSINEQISLLSRLKPINLDEELKIFFKNSNYSPRFIYRQNDLDTAYLKNELKKIPTHVSHPLMPLYNKKIDEIKIKLALVENIGQPKVMEYARRLYGQASQEQYQQAIDYITRQATQPDLSKRLRLEEVSKRIAKYLSDNKLSRWKIKILENATSGMQINKKNTIFIRKKTKITENRLKSMIAHEIDTHIFRLENGRLQKYKLFEQGTAGYLTTEEGLAIYNQNKLNLPLGDKMYRPALSTIAIHLGDKMSFIGLYKYLTRVHKVDKTKAWWICVRTKRGLQDTSLHGAFSKDLVYFSGHTAIKQFIQNNNTSELKKLFIGKIGIDDLPYLGDIKQWPIKYLPDYLK